MDLQVEKVAKILVDRSARICLVESCTGGLISKMLTDIPGSSKWFECGLVTYSNESKIALVGVPSEVIAQYGAVSAETAKEMAMGALKRFDMCHYSISVTGIAGPGGGSVAKPVGTVFFGLGVRDEHGAISASVHGKHIKGDSRDQIRNESAKCALSLFLELFD